MKKNVLIVIHICVFWLLDRFTSAGTKAVIVWYQCQKHYWLLNYWQVLFKSSLFTIVFVILKYLTKPAKIAIQQLLKLTAPFVQLRSHNKTLKPFISMFTKVLYWQRTIKKVQICISIYSTYKHISQYIPSMTTCPKN